MENKILNFKSDGELVGRVKSVNTGEVIEAPVQISELFPKSRNNRYVPPELSENVLNKFAKEKFIEISKTSLMRKENKMEDKGIDMTIRIDFERRAKYLKDYYSKPPHYDYAIANSEITKQMVYESFKEALLQQASNWKDGDSKVTEISLDGAENEKIFVKKLTPDFLELSGRCEFRIDTNFRVEVNENDDSKFKRIKIFISKI